MDCNLLNADIGSCTTPSYKGFKRTGWFTMKSNIDEASVVISDATVKFGLKSGMFYEIYDDSVNPFSGSGATVEVSSNHGYKFFNPTVKFPIKPFNPDYAVVVAGLTQGSELVVILEQEEKGTDDTSRYVVFGLQGGLYCTTPMFEMANDSVWEIELVENRTDELALFLYDTDLAGTTALKTLLIDYEYISGLTVASGTITPQQISLMTSGTTLRNYVILPDGSTLTSTTSTVYEVIDDTWAGAAGNIILVIPKLSTSVIIGAHITPSLSASDYIGNLVYQTNWASFSANGCDLTSITASNSTGNLHAGYSTSITSLNAIYATEIHTVDSSNLVTIAAENAEVILATGCKLSADSIASILSAAVANISDYSNISYDFSGGTSAAFSALSAQAQSDDATLTAGGATTTYN